MLQVFLLAVCATGLSLTAGLIPAHLLDTEWLEFKQQYGRQYSMEEDNLRYNIWRDNSEMIEQHNLEARAGLHTYLLAMNQFGDMSNEDYAAKMLGYKSDEKRKRNTKDVSKVGELPDSIDWLAEGYVTAVGNQGQCGSCWAFTATGALEGQHKRKTGKLVSLSEQNLMECSGKQGNQGCSGGFMDLSFKYVKENGGIDTESSYPYTSTNGTVGKCKFTRSNVGATCTGFVDLPKGDEKALQVATATIGPMSVAVDATSEGFQFYKTGVLNDTKCNAEQINHSLLITGYGVEDGVEYWECKNSWGTTWGNEGYIRMSRNRKNQCGIANEVSYPTV